MRTIVRAPLFESLLRNLHPSVQRCDEAVAGVERVIARFPYRCPVIPGTDKRVAMTRQLFDVPALLIYFTIDDENTCTLWGLEIIEGQVLTGHLDED